MFSPPWLTGCKAKGCCVDQKEESFYTVDWGCEVDRTPFLVAGGSNGIIRVLDAASEKICKALTSSIKILYLANYYVS